MLRKMMLLGATMLVMSLLAVTPAFAQPADPGQGGFSVVCNLRAHAGQGQVLVVSGSESSGILVFPLAGPFPTREEALAAAEAFGGRGAVGCSPNAPAPGQVPGQGPGQVPGQVPGTAPGQVEQVPFVVESDVEQEAESGDVNIGFDVRNTGDYASQCTPAIQFGNTGNFQNGSSFVQFGSGFNNDRNDFGRFGNHFFNRGGIDDFEPGGIDVSFDPQQNVDCSNTIQQSSAASSN